MRLCTETEETEELKQTQAGDHRKHPGTPAVEQPAEEKRPAFRRRRHGFRRKRNCRIGHPPPDKHSQKFCNHFRRLLLRNVSAAGKTQRPRIAQKPPERVLRLLRQHRILLPDQNQGRKLYARKRFRQIFIFRIADVLPRRADNRIQPSGVAQHGRVDIQRMLRNHRVAAIDITQQDTRKKTRAGELKHPSASRQRKRGEFHDVIRHDLIRRTSRNQADAVQARQNSRIRREKHRNNSSVAVSNQRYAVQIKMKDETFDQFRLLIDRERFFRIRERKTEPSKIRTDAAEIRRELMHNRFPCPRKRSETMQKQHNGSRSARIAAGDDIIPDPEMRVFRTRLNGSCHFHLSGSAPRKPFCPPSDAQSAMKEEDTKGCF